MEAAGFLNNEKILVGNITNGERFETYCIPAPAGSGKSPLMVPLLIKGNQVTFWSYLLLFNSTGRGSRLEPRLIVIEEDNTQFKEITNPIAD